MEEQYKNTESSRVNSKRNVKSISEMRGQIALRMNIINEQNRRVVDRRDRQRVQMDGTYKDTQIVEAFQRKVTLNSAPTTEQ